MACRLDHHFDACCLDNSLNVRRDRELARADRIVQLRSGRTFDNHIVRHPGDMIGVSCGAQRAIADHGNPHTRCVAGYLIGDALGHEACTKQAHLQRFLFLGAFCESGIDNDHEYTPETQFQSKKHARIVRVWLTKTSILRRLSNGSIVHSEFLAGMRHSSVFLSQKDPHF